MPSVFKRLLSSLRTGRTSPFRTKGSTGTASTNGFIVDNERNPRLSGESKYQTYENLVFNVSIIAASVRYYLNLVSKATWSVEPSDPDDPQAIEIAEFMEKAMVDMETPWHSVIRTAAPFRFQGRRQLPPWIHW